MQVPGVLLALDWMDGMMGPADSFEMLLSEVEFL
jgi:hypothetical protein